MRLATLVVVPAVLLAASACAGVSNTAAPSTTVVPPTTVAPTTTVVPTTTVAPTTTTLPPLVEVVISGFSFGSPIQVSTGQTIRFTNLDGASHTATSGAFDSGNIGSGQSAEITLDTPGNYTYSCSYHPHMTGTIIVVEG